MELLKINEGLVFAEQNKCQKKFQSYLHLFGSLLLNRSSLVYTMIRLGEESKKYEKELAELLTFLLILKPPQEIR